MSKIYSKIILSTALMSSVAIPFANAEVSPKVVDGEKANTEEIQNKNMELTKNFNPQLEKAFEEMFQSETTESDSNKLESVTYDLKVPVSRFIIKDLASGKTSLSYNKDKKKVTSTGTTKGKIYTTTTSATTSVGTVKGGIAKKGSKAIKLAKFTATSKASMKKKAKKTKYAGITIHTATYMGSLYERKSGKATSY